MRRAALMLLVLAVLAGCQKGKDDKEAFTRFNEGQKAGQTAIDFYFKDLDERPFRLSEERGKAVIIYFWRLKCPECVGPMDSLEALNRRYRDKGLVVVSVGADTMHSAPIAQVVEFLKKNGYTFRTLRDSEGFVSEAFGVVTVPQAFIIDKKGVIAAVRAGKTDWMSAENTSLIETLLRRE